MIPEKTYKKIFYLRAEQLFDDGFYKEASQFYEEYLQSLRYRPSNIHEKNYKVALNRKLASDLLAIKSENIDPTKSLKKKVATSTSELSFVVICYIYAPEFAQDMN